MAAKFEIEIITHAGWAHVVTLLQDRTAPHRAQLEEHMKIRAIVGGVLWAAVLAGTSACQDPTRSGAKPDPDGPAHAQTARSERSILRIGMPMDEAKAAMIAASGFISSRTLAPLGERCEDAWYVFPNEQYVHLLGRAGLADKDLLLTSIQAGTWGERNEGNWIPRAGLKGGWIDASQYRELDPADIAARGQDWPTIFDANGRGIGE